MEIGKCYYVRTLTDHWIGRVIKTELFAVTLEDASWVADSGRLHIFMRDGKADNMEIEPVHGSGAGAGAGAGA
jgi:hypothetical protein